MKAVVPEGEGPGIPLSIRFPTKLIERIDACAEKTNNNRTETMMHLLRWALDEFEAQTGAEASVEGVSPDAEARVPSKPRKAKQKG